MRADVEPKKVFLKDYKPSEFLIDSVELYFNLGEELTVVRNTMKIRRNPLSTERTEWLRLSGEHIELERVKVDGQELLSQAFELTETGLNLKANADQFTVEISTRCLPQKNLSFDGLYKTGSMFCTQCEAEGFRKITYFIDRPDVLATYTVTIEAEKKKYPLLLSNGNLVAKSDLENGRHIAKWQDPWPKPCYLFALVAGDLGVLEDTFTTRSGRKVDLQIFAKHGHQDRCKHAMWSLKESMRWDEEVFGREYDLDLFMIVAADDFNMGAMENKGLNIFNSNYVLARPDTATDTDYDNILAVIGHEYFHNWTGNRITCRDWFQLSLKEGLTVFRDQQFSGDMGSRAVHRINDIVRLRTHQFAEDDGPMAHPIRPSAFLTIDNFYTMTVYEKGAEVIRMIHTILGPHGFRQGMDLYFERHDGQAVTTDDFVSAMADANNVDFSKFKNWYSQAGVPTVAIRTDFNAVAKTFSITLSQSCRPTPETENKKPFHIPFALGLLNSRGEDLIGTQVLQLKEQEQTFEFKGIGEKPIVSALRGFSAPVRLQYEQTPEELAFIMAHDSDFFSRWEASQKLCTQAILGLINKFGAQADSSHVPAPLVNAYAAVIRDPKMDKAYKALMLGVPEASYINQFITDINPDAVFAARRALQLAIVSKYENELAEVYSNLQTSMTDEISAGASADRDLKNRALSLLCLLKTGTYRDQALSQLRSSPTMTDSLGALAALNSVDSPERTTAMTEFYEKWKHEPLVINKWLGVQAAAPFAGGLDRVRKLMTDPVFDITNPNKIYSLPFAFAMVNHTQFHETTGESYKFIADCVMDIDSRNPQVAARVVSSFNQWKKFDSKRRDLAKVQLERILSHKGLSTNVTEIVSNSLKL